MPKLNDVTQKILDQITIEDGIAWNESEDQEEFVYNFIMKKHKAFKAIYKETFIASSLIMQYVDDALNEAHIDSITIDK